ncbi:MAG: molybdopterin-binding oxidoreductase, partial [Massilia sp.]|nr:molybdopterin-binding oxidoreductase [Massilia sp.]
TALVHPLDARRLGLVDGAMAAIANGERRIEAQVEVSAGMMPGGSACRTAGATTWPAFD